MSSAPDDELPHAAPRTLYTIDEEAACAAQGDGRCMFASLYAALALLGLVGLAAMIHWFGLLASLLAPFVLYGAYIIATGSAKLCARIARRA
jgi:hypothetical protein